jgi:hypothetical protein
MKIKTIKCAAVRVGLAASVLLLGSGAAFGQQIVNLTAGPTTATVPDGSTVPMWGYSCAGVTGTVTCAPLNPAARTTSANTTSTTVWSPIVITVPAATTGATSLTINLTNNLSFTPNGGGTPNNIPTSLTIVGQVGGGLGTPSRAPSPQHAQLGVSWATVAPPGTGAAGAGATFTPPSQPDRVQSFGTEVAAGTGTATALKWNNLRPGTYLIESGTHPSIQGPMGLYGILVVTQAPVTTGTPAAGCAYPTSPTSTTCAASYDAEIPLLLSEIDPVQNTAVNAAVNTSGFSETRVWSGQPGQCGNPGAGSAYQTCYPPAVNYTPLYYLINGVGFSRANAQGSVFSVAPGTIPSPSLTLTPTGTVLVRMVNAGLKMHVPSIVGSVTNGVSGTGAAALASGFTLVAEDGNLLPPTAPRVQTEVFMAAGKTFDVMINGPANGSAASALPIYDRELSLSGDAIERDAGMLAYISINGAGAPAATSLGAATANPDTYKSVVPGQTLVVSDAGKGVLANDLNVYGVKVVVSGVAQTGAVAGTNGTLTLNTNGTFTYVANAGAPTSGTVDTFTYCGNGATSGAACTTLTFGAGSLEASSGITCTAGIAFTSTMANYIAVKTPGILANCKDGAGYALTIDPTTVTPSAGLTVLADVNGGFTAVYTGQTPPNFTVQAKNAQGTRSAAIPVTLTFPTGSGLNVTVLDGYDHKTPVSDYRWIIEEDKTFFVDPKCVQNPPPPGCPTAGSGIVPTLGVNFHTSHMGFVAQGCTGPVSCEAGQTVLGQPSVCDVGNGACRPDPNAGTNNAGMTQVLPSQVQLDPTKRYYISVLPGDAADPFAAGYTGIPCGQAGADPSTCAIGHGMGGAPIAAGQNSVTVLTQPSPYPPANLSVFVFEDDFPLNGEQDGGGGVDVLSPQEPGLGGFQIHLWDAMGGSGDFTGQMTYDMFNQPLTNGLDGTIDPLTNQNACPITQIGIANPGTNAASGPTGTSGDQATTGGITGMIVTCPKYEQDGKTLSPLAGQAVIKNLMPGRWGVIATPGADRIARGEEWLQTNTLDGQKAHDSFTKIGEPTYFQEFGPAGFHVTIGFANPAIINARKPFVCNGTDAAGPSPGQKLNCGNTIMGKVTGQRLSRTPDERLYESGSHDTYNWTQCYVSFGDPDGEDFAFTKCDADGNFTLTGLPDGDWRVTTFDQWNDQLVDGLSTPVRLGSATNPSCPGAGSNASTCNLGNVAATQWQTNLYTRTFIDDNKDGISQADETGIPLVTVAVRLRDGSLENLNQTDFTGAAPFNETFPLFSWYTVETDVTRYKNTGTHVVYDVGGPADGSSACGKTGYPPCGNSTIGHLLANTQEQMSVPASLRIPGAVYCADADCSGQSIQKGPISGGSSGPAPTCTSAGAGGGVTCTNNISSGRIDPPSVGVEGWQGFPGQNNFLEFGKTPYVPGENGGIKGHVVYASTRPFDDPQLLVQTQWEPLVPNVRINLYKEGFQSDGVTPTLTLVDTTTTSSFDDWAQGFRSDGVPNMNCPGQGASSGPLGDLFFFSLYNQPQYLDLYNRQHAVPGSLNAAATGTSLPYNSQFKCYDGMHNWNQLQPAPYDGMYQFPSVTGIDPTTGKPTGTNCTGCVSNPDSSDPYRSGTPMLPAGKYVVEVVLPNGYELVKEEDKNILIGDNFIAPVAQQFGGLGNVFILPDQASVAAQGYPGPGYNANNAQNSTNSLGTVPSNNIVPGFVPEPTWPCVGEARVVPDFISLYPQTKQVAPFAGATRNLCDRKEVTLNDQSHSIAKFYVYTSTHIASKFMGGITDDYTSEFDPFSPQFGEKFAPPDLPVSVRDWTGNETNRVYADHWGAYNGMTYSTWEVNPPNPTGYSPSMMVMCMNDPGPIAGPNGTTITDPLFSEGYSQFCYELPFMPGTTDYLDTPVVPTSAFAGAGYNNVDCAYPDATPAVAEVDGDGVGPWVSKAGSTLTIKALGDQQVPNNAYSGPSANTAPYNQKTVKRHYGFGAQCTSPTAGSAACNTKSTVTIGGVNATITNWADSQITVTVPSGIPQCAIQQQAQYGGPNGTTVSAALCGELAITAGNGKQSIDAVTVTVGGKSPTHVAASGSVQAAIDAAAPGDLIIVDPTCNAAGAAVSCQQSGAVTTTLGAHYELLLMWKPVRLQGVGAASSLINASTHPAGKLDPWRRSINCLFGLSLNGQPATTGNAFDATSAFNCPYGTGAAGGTGPDGNTWKYFTGTAGTVGSPQVDRLPLEAVVGWDATQNGNLAEQLQEPSLMGALEGAGITVLAKGLQFPAGQDPFGGGAANAGTFPTGTTLLTGNMSSTGTLTVGDANALCHTSRTSTTNPYPSNFVCNPSSIDGLTVTQSSQGGGAIYIHGWGHYLQVANNRIQNNAGTLSGGINLGQGEFPPSYIAGAGATNAPPGSCLANAPTNVQLPYCHNVDVNVHNNSVSLNSSTGDELFSATPAGAGGISVCTGSDYYKFNNNWVCGNLSSGDGGGLGHIGFSYNGDIEHNTFVFNQSTNPTIPANGGGLIIMGAPDADPTCGATTDQDCVPTPGSITPSDGVGPNLVINANLIMGNAAESGTGGGIAFQSVNGTDVLTFPTTPSRWYSPKVTNNIIVNNVAGWDGAGVSLLDALNINIVNNTIASNSSTATAGPLFNTIGAPIASQPTPAGTPAQCGSSTCTTSPPQVAGLVSLQNSAVLEANLPATITCPANHFAGGTASNGTCRKVSYPLLFNNALWQNSSYYIGVGALSPQFQQNVISLYNAFTTTLAPTQSQADGTTPNLTGGVTITGGTGACTAASYWDIGVRGDTGPTNHGSTVTLAPQYSLITSVGTLSDYAAPGLHNTATAPGFVSQYCDGSRQPPELGASGWAVPAGISDATVPNPVFNLTPVATVDEGNNWVNMRWGPLSTTNPTVTGADGNYGSGAPLGNYSLASTSSGAYNAGAASVGAGGNAVAAPNADFFGNTRPQAGAFDIGAVEYVASTTPSATVSPTTLAFGNWRVGHSSGVMFVTVTNTGGVGLTGGTFVLGGGTPQTFTRVTTGTFPAGAPNCGNTLAVGAKCSIGLTFTAPAATSYSRTLTVNYGNAGVVVTGSVVTLTGSGTNTAATVSIAPNPLTVTLPSGQFTGSGTITVTNTAPSGGTSTVVTGVGYTGGSFISYFFNTAPGTDTCTGTNLAPGQSCTIGVEFTNIDLFNSAPRGSNRSGTIRLTDDATGSPQAGNLTGFATP